MSDLISRQAALDAVKRKDWILEAMDSVQDGEMNRTKRAIVRILAGLPSAQPEIIRCKDCKHWTQSVGKMKGYGLGRCDFHDADLVTYNGFCYWAERRTDE